MGLAAKILAGLNIIAAFVLFYFAGKAFYARQNWMDLIEKRQAVRDGVNTESVITKANPVHDTLAGTVRQRLEQMGPEASEFDAELRYLNARLREWELLKSDYAKRKAASEFLLETLPKRPEAILAEDNQRLAAELGAEDYRKILQEFRALHAPKLQTEEMNLLSAKDSLLQAQKGYDQHIADLKVKIAKLGSREQNPNEIIEAEKALKAKLDVENEARRKELAELYTELEEKSAAKALAEGRERDMRDLLAKTRQLIQELTKENQDTANRLREREGVQIGRGN